MNEWEPLLETENYEASKSGKIRNAKTRRILKTSIDKQGREVVRLSIDGVQKNKRVGRLVAGAFYGEQCIGMKVYHLDGDQSKNELDNLEIGTQSDVVRNSYENNRNMRNKKAVRIVETGEEFDSITECSEYLGVSPAVVSKSLNYEFCNNKLGLHFERIY